MKNKTKKNAKQKTFFFEDYTASKININNKNNNLIKVSLSRITFLFFIFFIFAFIFSIKIVYLSLSSEKTLLSKNTEKNFIKAKKYKEAIGKLK